MSASVDGGYMTAARLVGLPGLPGTERGIRDKAQRESWHFRERSGRGGGREYRVADLPAETRAALVRKLIETQPALPAAASGPDNVVALPPPGARRSPAQVPARAEAGPLPTAGHAIAMNRRDPLSFKDWQRDAANARAGVIRLVHRIAAASSCSTDAALDALNRALADGSADDAALRLVERANVRRRSERGTALNRSTFFRWKRAFEVGGVDALAPEETHHEHLPPWARLALDLYRRPQKPSIAFVREKLPEAICSAGLQLKPPSYGQLRRFLMQQVGAIARNDGRMGPKELKAVSPFVRRSTAKLWAGDVYTSDGHTFKAEVAHPAHGRPFRPEITTVLDVATRKCVGWSTSLDENQFGVLDAQRRAFTTHGVCAIWYVDRGSGFDNSLQKDPMLGFAARIGFEVRHSLPYNSQARGLEERSHQTILVRAAKQLPTFIGAAMDREAKNRVFKLVRRDVKSVGTSRLLMPWEAFCPYIQQAVDAYNARPHRALPRIRDDDGRLRHMSPDEAWAQHLADGAQVTAIEHDEARDLFWPQKAVKCTRGELRLFNKRYFAASLAEYDGEVLRVGYDIADPRRVVVRDLAGRWLVDAELDGNVRDYFAESVLAEAARKRHEGRLRRIAAKREEIEQELAGRKVVEAAPAKSEFDWSQIEDQSQGASEATGSHKPEQAGSTPAPATNADAEGRPDAAFAEHEAKPSAPRPTFQWFGDRYEWLMQHRDAWTEQDRVFLGNYVASEDYALLAEMYAAQGLAWSDDKPMGFNAAG